MNGEILLTKKISTKKNSHEILVDHADSVSAWSMSIREHNVSVVVDYASTTTTVPTRTLKLLNKTMRVKILRCCHFKEVQISEITYFNTWYLTNNESFVFVAESWIV